MILKTPIRPSPSLQNDNLMHATSSLLLVTLCSATAFAAEPAAWTVASPDNKLALTFTLGEDHHLSYTFRADGRELIAKSRVGYETAGVTEKSRHAIDSAWKPLWGKRAVVPERFRELVLDCKTYQLEARAYDDGVAFRYVGGSGPEGTDFQFAGDRLRQLPRQLGSLPRPFSQCPHATLPLRSRHGM
jgi:alpha-glucosidase